MVTALPGHRPAWWFASATRVSRVSAWDENRRRPAPTVVTMRLLRARPLLLDGVLASALGTWAQVMVWSGRVAGPRLAMAVLFLLVGFPLVVRRRALLVPVVLLMTAILVQSVSTADAAEGAPLLVAALACAYAVAAYGARPPSRLTSPTP